MTGEVTIPLLPCAAVDDMVEFYEALTAGLSTLPLTDAERDQLADLSPGGDAGGLGTEQ